MSKKVSCTVTVGAGSEKHNHDLRFRESLNHTRTADCQDAIIELVPYRPYQTQINEMMKPYIDEYNHRQQERYEAAWARYNAGEIRTKPRKRDYKPMSDDYYTDHLHDQQWNPRTKKMEDVPIYREVIFGLGDQNDRKSGLITRDEAVAVMTNVVARWPEIFPDLKLLGASIHLDEEGFYHCHIDYKPLYEKENPERGLTVGTGQDAALEKMGFTPEQSIINGRDKVPILFNAFRNRLYLETEKELNRYGLRLMYGASKIKEPGKDSSVNQQLEVWQATRDGVHEVQMLKNNMLDIVQGDHVSPEGFKQAVTAAENVTKALDELQQQPRSRINKDNVIVPFRLLDQLRSFVLDVVNTVKHLLQQIDILEDHLDHYENIQEKLDGGGKIFSKLEWMQLQAEQKRRVAEEEKKTSRLESALRGLGISQREVEKIKNGGKESEASWGNK